MTIEFPNDSDGDALRRALESGSDVAKPIFIDFHVAMPTEQSANVLAALARKLGYRTSVYDSAECRLPWTCQCSTRMLATYDGVLAIQAELAALSAPLEGFTDGWGTFGNGPTGQPDVE
jgi:regulator of RNase E activity RraB